MEKIKKSVEFSCIKITMIHVDVRGLQFAGVDHVPSVE
jgi:hypothetical protein